MSRVMLAIILRIPYWTSSVGLDIRSLGRRFGCRTNGGLRVSMEINKHGIGWDKEQVGFTSCSEQVSNRGLAPKSLI